MAEAIILLFTLLGIKHFICDFPFSIQTPWMFLNKGTYGHHGGIAHALVHMFGTWVALVLFVVIGSMVGIPPPSETSDGLDLIFVIISEGIIHYHMDWFKVWFGKLMDWHVKTPQFWTFLGVDQLVHYLTYVWMIWVLFT